MLLASVLPVLAHGHTFVAEPAWRGVDMSQLATEDGGGARPPFRAARGAPTVDALLLLRRSGVNVFRMRLWNDPCADGRCDASKYSYGGLPGVLSMAQRCQAANLTFVLDIHYSDWWADPGQQFKPRAWRRLSYPQLAAAVYNFTRSSVGALVAQGTPPYAVQIGNEITHGFLWDNATLGQTCPGLGFLHRSQHARGALCSPLSALRSLLSAFSLSAFSLSRSRFFVWLVPA